MKPTAFDIVPDVALDLDALDVEELEPRLEFCTLCYTFSKPGPFGTTVTVTASCGCL